MKGDSKRRSLSEHFYFLQDEPKQTLRKFVRALNDKRDPDGEWSVRNIFKTMKDIEGAVRRVFGGELEDVEFYGLMPYQRRQGYTSAEATQIIDFHKMCNRTQYSLRPTLDSSGWNFYLEHKAKIDSPIERLNSNIALIQAVAEMGVLSSIRECSLGGCKRWFAATKKTHRFCKEPHRKKYYARSDEGKAKHRKYMRTYRANLKRRDESAKKYAAIRKKRKR
jgi:hypothetical protein